MKYLLMHKRTAVLELDIDKLGMIAKIGAVSAPEHLPVGVRTSKSGVDRASFNEWWADRCIPASRSGVRDALQALGVAVPQQLLSRSYGLSLSDRCLDIFQKKSSRIILMPGPISCIRMIKNGY